MTIKFDSVSREKIKALLPPHMHGGVFRYFEEGVPPGDFLRAVLENDLVGAFMRADDKNTYHMRAWAEFLYMYAPGRPNGGWGSPEAVDRWLQEAADERRRIADSVVTTE